MTSAPDRVLAREVIVKFMFLSFNTTKNESLTKSICSLIVPLQPCEQNDVIANRGLSERALARSSWTAYAQIAHWKRLEKKS